MDPLDVIARAGAAAFATDEKGRIVIWNESCSVIDGVPAGLGAAAPAVH